MKRKTDIQRRIATISATLMLIASVAFAPQIIGFCQTTFGLNPLFATFAAIALLTIIMWAFSRNETLVDEAEAMNDPRGEVSRSQR